MQHLERDRAVVPQVVKQVDRGHAALAQLAHRRRSRMVERDGTAARSAEAYHAALNIDGPTYAHEILTTAEWVQAIKASVPAFAA